MSNQIEMKELKDWLNDPTALKFKRILTNSRAKLLDNMSHNYIGQQGNFNKDLVISALGGCEALEQISNYFGVKDENAIAELLNLFYGGLSE
jgi:hypothetical protein